MIPNPIFKTPSKTYIPFVKPLSATTNSDPEEMVNWFRKVVAEFAQHWKV
jgi:hypothetical protein